MRKAINELKSKEEGVHDLTSEREGSHDLTSKKKGIQYLMLNGEGNLRLNTYNMDSINDL